MSAAKCGYWQSWKWKSMYRDPGAMATAAWIGFLYGFYLGRGNWSILPYLAAGTLVSAVAVIGITYSLWCRWERARDE